VDELTEATYGHHSSSISVLKYRKAQTDFDFKEYSQTSGWRPFVVAAVRWHSKKKSHLQISHTMVQMSTESIGR
jgi:hypothetical protein